MIRKLIRGIIGTATLVGRVSARKKSWSAWGEESVFSISTKLF